MEINKIIAKIRFKLNDANEVKFSDYDVLMAINESYKQYREICMEEAPAFISVKRKGVVGAGNNTIPVGDVAEVIELRSNDRVLKAKDKLPRLQETGSPSEYALGVGYIDDVKVGGVLGTSVLGEFVLGALQSRASTNSKGLCLFLHPTPTNIFNYELICIEQATDLTTASNLDVPNDIANCIIDFSVNALSGRQDEYMSVDSKLRNILRRYIPVVDYIESYY